MISASILNRTDRHAFLVLARIRAADPSERVGDDLLTSADRNHFSRRCHSFIRLRSPVLRDTVDGQIASRSRFLQRKEICRTASQECYVAEDVGTEWPIPVFCCVLACPLRSPPQVTARRGHSVHDCGQWALATRPACREMAD